jgi:hypothetical protein
MSGFLVALMYFMVKSQARNDVFEEERVEGTSCEGWQRTPQQL